MPVENQIYHATRCSPASSPITISPTEIRPISDIRVGDTVLAFDPAAGLGRGALVPRRVVRPHRNVTREWVRPGWEEDGGRVPATVHQVEEKKAA